MAKNFSEDHLDNRVPNAINQALKQTKQNRSDQTQGKGFFPFPVGTSDPIDAPNGSIYYNSSTGVFRKKVSGSWTNAGI